MTKSTHSSLIVNGEMRSTPADPSTPLLYVLRNDLELNGAKFGCGAGQCGACTVLLNGNPIRSCITTLQNIPTGSKITTIEGLTAKTSELSILQNAFIEEQAAQCGYCINGVIMTAKAFLDKTPNPNEDQIRKALAGNLCRCGTHSRIIKAVQKAAKQIKQSVAQEMHKEQQKAEQQKTEQQSEEQLSSGALS